MDQPRTPDGRFTFGRGGQPLGSLSDPFTTAPVATTLDQARQAIASGADEVVLRGLRMPRDTDADRLVVDRPVTLRVEGGSVNLTSPLSTFDDHVTVMVDPDQPAYVITDGGVSVDAPNAAYGTTVQTCERACATVGGRGRLIMLKGSGDALATDQAEVEALDGSLIASGRSRVTAGGDAKVRAIGSADVWAAGRSVVWAMEDATVTVDDVSEAHVVGDADFERYSDDARIFHHSDVYSPAVEVQP